MKHIKDLSFLDNIIKNPYEENLKGVQEFMLKILWITENEFNGKYNRNFNNCRTEIAWVIASDGYHIHIGELPKIPNNTYDIAIIILPKREDILQQISTYTGFDLIGHMRRVGKKIGWMQEGNIQYFQNYSIPIQMWWYGVLEKIDFLMVHNEYDKKYIEGLFNKPIFVNRSLIIEDNIKPSNDKRNNVIIGGTFCEWYNGFSSYIVATKFEEDIFAPSMGRIKEGENQLKGITYLPYMNWREWIYKLSEFKYAVHMMPTVAAGTFSLNCGFLGIPVIGNEKIDTQHLLFPELSVDTYDIGSANKLALRLKNDKDFYKMCSNDAQKAYNHYYSEKEWKNNFFKFMGK